MKIKGAIFDMDGTLLNSMDYWATVAEEYLQNKGFKYENDTNKIFLEAGMKSWYTYHAEKFGLNIPFDEVKKEINSMMSKNYKTVVVAKEGVYQMLENLKNHGVKMCLATATDRELVEDILKKLGLEKYFSRIFTSGEVGKGKRDPLIYNLALEYLGTPKDETYIFEDAYYAIKTAHDNNLKVVGVYDKNAYVSKNEIKSLCDYYIDEKDNYLLELE